MPNLFKQQTLKEHVTYFSYQNVAQEIKIKQDKIKNKTKKMKLYTRYLLIFQANFIA